MEEIVSKSKCSGCSACYSVCPKNAISMNDNGCGFLYPDINDEKCIDCNLCKKVCPSISNERSGEIIKSFACYSMDENVRLNSSSGGIFSVIASYVINNGGCVFGAAFDDDFFVNHIMVDNLNDLYKLRTSKYLQSYLKDSFILAKKELDEGRLVLFTGTPCQIDGLTKYLRKDYSNLITQDIICHGCPSPKMWNKYLTENYLNPKNINFRDKGTGWKLFGLRVDESVVLLNKDKYMHMFLKDLILRDSCYKCSSRGLSRSSDITLADLWGSPNIVPEMDDNKGLSFVLINSSKGMELYNNISNDLISREIDSSMGIKYNKAMIESPSKRKCVDELFSKIDELSFNELYKRYRIKVPVYKLPVVLMKKVVRKFIK